MTDCKNQGTIAIFPSVSWASMSNDPYQWRIAKIKGLSLRFPYFVGRLCPITLLSNWLQKSRDYRNVSLSFSGVYVQITLLNDGLQNSRDYRNVCLTFLGDYVQSPFSMTDCTAKDIFHKFLSQQCPTTLLSDWLQCSRQIHHVSFSFFGNYVQWPLSVMDCKVHGNVFKCLSLS